MVGFLLLGGAILGAVSQSIATAVQVRQSKAAARKNRKFQIKMRGTQMQARVEDLRLAGLNPILAAGGPGAASPSGSVAQIPDIGGQVGKGAASVREALLAKSRLKSEASARGLAAAQTLESAKHAELYDEQKSVALTQADYNAQSARAVRIQGDLAETALPGKREEEKLIRGVPALKWINTIRRSIMGGKD